MILPLHITVALLSAAYTFLTYLFPSHTKIKISGILIAGTVISGSILVINLRANLVRSCMMGLLFIGFSLAAIIAAQHKLASQKESTFHER